MKLNNCFHSTNAKIRHFKKLLKGSTVVIGCVITLAPFALEADNTYTVDTLDDPVVNSDGTLAPGSSGTTSLRSAILKANSSGAPAGNVSAGVPSLINFASGTSGTINLNTELPLIFSSLTIDGGAGVVLNGNAPGTTVWRGLFINGLPPADTPNGPPQNINVTLSNLTIQNMTATGGNGSNDASSSGGGGGMGAGGALFVGQNSNLRLMMFLFQAINLWVAPAALAGLAVVLVAVGVA